MKKLIACLALFPSFALAEFQVPDGCTAYMTVQSKMCTVTHHYTCAGDPAGHQWRADLDENGPYFVSQIDGETRWISSFDLTSGEVDRLDEAGSNDHASFTNLVRGDVDEFDFRTINNLGDIVHVKGSDRLTGRTVVIDDIPLLETASDVTATDGGGNFLWHAKGNEYISLEHRMFLSGPTAWRNVDGTSLVDGSPMEFIFPGERGFLTETPKYDCGAVMSALPETAPTRAALNITNTDLATLLKGDGE